MIKIVLASLIAIVIISGIIIPHDVLAKNKGKKFLRETKHFLGDTKQFFRDLTDQSQTANASLVDKLTKKGEDLNRPVCEAAQKGDKDQVAFEFDKIGVMLGIHLSETMREGILSACPK